MKLWTFWEGGKVFLGGGYWGVSICGLCWCLQGILCLGWFNFVCFFLFCLLLCVLLGGWGLAAVVLGEGSFATVKVGCIDHYHCTCLRTWYILFFSFLKKLWWGVSGTGGLGGVSTSLRLLLVFGGRVFTRFFFWWRVVRREGDPLPLGGR